MMSQLSYFHLGHLTVKDTEHNITIIYGLVEVGVATYIVMATTQIIHLLILVFLMSHAEATQRSDVT